MSVDLFEHWIFWGIVMVLALVFLAVAKARSFNDTAKATVDGKKWTLGFDKIWWSVNYGRAIAAVVIVGLVLMMFGCNADWNEGDKTVATRYCPAVMEDSIDMSPYEDRVKALAIEAESKGIKITGDYWADVAAQGGEMTLVGAVRIEVDANCQIVSNGSWMTLFNADRYPMTGGVDAQGNLGMDANFGGAIVNVRGKIVDGKVTNGKALKSWLPHIYGQFDGDWSLR